jgi:hypothetical protein
MLTELGAEIARSVECVTAERATGIRSPAEAEGFSSSLCAQTGSETHPAYCTMGIRGPFLGVKRGRGTTLSTHPM